MSVDTLIRFLNRYFPIDSGVMSKGNSEDDDAADLESTKLSMIMPLLYGRFSSVNLFMVGIVFIMVVMENIRITFLNYQSRFLLFLFLSKLHILVEVTKGDYTVDVESVEGSMMKPLLNCRCNSEDL